MKVTRQLLRSLISPHVWGIIVWRKCNNWKELINKQTRTYAKQDIATFLTLFETGMNIEL